MADPVTNYLDNTKRLLGNLDITHIDAMLEELRDLQDDGNRRLFCIGNGGGAAHASHAATDFRKIGGIEAYAYDNLAELTARINDDGWETCIVDWLKACRFSPFDALLVFSVGGGSETVSVNLTNAIRYASYVVNATILGICGEAGGTLDKYARTCIVIPTSSTPQVEGIQAVLWHLLVSAL